MTSALKKFTVKQLKEPGNKGLDNDIEWICNSLGFVSSRDQGQTAYKILRALVKSAKEGKGMTSEALAKIVDPTIGSVIYHLQKLKKAGLVVKLDSAYELRMNSMVGTINEIEKDLLGTLMNIKNIAEDIDKKIGLESR